MGDYISLGFGLLMLLVFGIVTAFELRRDLRVPPHQPSSRRLPGKLGGAGAWLLIAGAVAYNIGGDGKSFAITLGVVSMFLFVAAAVAMTR